MNMYQYIRIVVLFLVCISCTDHKKGGVLTLAHGLPVSHPVHKGIVAFKKTLEEKSGGTLKVDIYPDGQLGSEREVLELLQIGSIAMTKVSTATMSNFVPEYKVLGIPYLFRDKEHFFKALEGDIGKELLEEGTGYWLKGLCFYDAGSRSFYTKEKQIQTPEDLNSMKIRVMNDPVAVKMVNALGGSPTPMSFGELYTALQQGVVDGAENNAPSFVTSRHFEICKYYTLDSHTYVPDLLLISTKFLNRLTKEEKKWIEESAVISAQLQKEYWEESVKESYDILKKAGVEIFIPDKELFSEKSKSVISSFKEPNEIALIQRILEIE